MPIKRLKPFVDYAKAFISYLEVLVNYLEVSIAHLKTFARLKAFIRRLKSACLYGHLRDSGSRKPLFACSGGASRGDFS